MNPRSQKRDLGHPIILRRSDLGHPPLLSKAIQALKLSVCVQSRERPFWQPRYYDFNVHSQDKPGEKLNYMHRNPVKRGLVDKPEDWPWSSYQHYATGKQGAVEIESFWTRARRDGLVNPRSQKRDLGDPDHLWLVRPAPPAGGSWSPRSEIRTWGTRSSVVSQTCATGRRFVVSQVRNPDLGHPIICG